MDKSISPPTPNSQTDTEPTNFIKRFANSSRSKQLEIIELLVNKLDHKQLTAIHAYIEPKLRTDVIKELAKNGCGHIVHKIFENLGADSLWAAQRVSNSWRANIDWNAIWKSQLIKQIERDIVFRSIAEKDVDITMTEDYRNAYSMESSTLFLISSSIKDGLVLRKLKQIDRNWAAGKFTLSRIDCHSDHSKGVYCLQYDDDKIVCGLRDKTMKVWKRTRGDDGLHSATLEFVLAGHTGSVLCLQYCGDIVVSGSSDGTIRIWSLSERRHLHTIFRHSEAVLHIRFDGRKIVSSSKDRAVAVIVIDFDEPDYVKETHMLLGHRAAVNVVDFDDRFIVSASGDRTIRVWNMNTLELVHSLLGHRRGIACLQFRGDLIVSGSSDNSVKIWNIISGECLRTLDGHSELVRCVRFDDRRIISGAYDGMLRVWDLEKALDSERAYSDEQCCMMNEKIHTGRIFRLQFDHKLIVSSAHDDTIAFIDFD